MADAHAQRLADEFEAVAYQIGLLRTRVESATFRYAHVDVTHPAVAGALVQLRSSAEGALSSIPSA